MLILQPAFRIYGPILFVALLAFFIPIIGPRPTDGRTALIFAGAKEFVELTERCLNENQEILDRFTRPGQNEAEETEARRSAADQLAQLFNNQHDRFAFFRYARSFRDWANEATDPQLKKSLEMLWDSAQCQIDFFYREGEDQDEVWKYALGAILSGYRSTAEAPFENATIPGISSPQWISGRRGVRCHARQNARPARRLDFRS